MDTEKFTWFSFYTDFADKLLPFKNNRGERFRILKAEYDALDMRYPFIDGGEVVDDTCPFAVFVCINKGISDDNRITLMSGIGKKIGVFIV